MSLLQLATPASARTFSPASFVPPGSPPTTKAAKSRSTTANPEPSFVYTTQQQQQRTTATASKECTSSSTLVLHAKKASAAAPTANKKIQVKMLKYVAGTGQAGEVVLVTPPYFNNKLRPTKSAELISDEQVQLENKEHEAEEKETLEQATSLQSLLTQEGLSLTITSKAGPAGQLFGGIGPKGILDTLKDQVSHPYWESHKKSVKIVSVMEDGKKMRGDIKHTGEYSVSVALTRDITAKVPLQVVGQE
eukprot:CAMPEP_0198144512 /NCGR_PEP_ID=MMETSP1443-20131203/16414_1 /TAXON_ID=186043 /ORGANISM="Entomoneis sp., Strain CCMP2396" /LENGTH=248 /DNA_ID=CAMNT_0043807919 /DNA_START=181 /DNA_END=927 /DNA_ORIENTATION=-